MEAWGVDNLKTIAVGRLNPLSAAFYTITSLEASTKLVEKRGLSGAEGSQDEECRARSFVAFYLLFGLYH